MAPLLGQVLVCHVVLLLLLLVSTSAVRGADPSPKPWPEQFHALLFQNSSGTLAVVDLWYDWPNGRNFNIIQHQLGNLLYDLEWTNGTSFYYDLDAKSCKVLSFEVGILRPEWMDNAHYLGVKQVGNYKCNVWEKADFITYYEDVETQVPVLWVFYTGREMHVVTFEKGRVLEDEGWQAPSYCFRDGKPEGNKVVKPGVEQMELLDSSLHAWRRSLAVSSK